MAMCKVMSKNILHVSHVQKSRLPVPYRTFLVRYILATDRG